MRLRRPDGSLVHVGYCTNVHPATGLDGILAQLRRYAVGVRAELGVDVLGVGLWLPAPVAARLAEDLGLVRRLRDELARLGLEVVTLNAFPYGDFHSPVVKYAVYRPDWTERSRLEHTLACARVLAALLPDDVATGSVSTLPLSWRTPWDDARREAARGHLGELARGLADIAATGPRVTVGLEPEPGCVWEVLDDVLTGPDRLAGLLTTEHLRDGLVGVCLDTCHSAVGFDDLADVGARVGAAGVPVVKLQAAAALHVPDPASPVSRAALAEFVEPRFLHQTRERPAADARPAGTDDLDEALAGGLPGEAPWRCHVHLPLHATGTAETQVATRALAASLDQLVAPVAPAGGRVDLVEVETYTWSVLPQEQRRRAGGAGRTTPGAVDDGLAHGLASELAWVRDHLLDHGLESA
ncbi:metabolite traffic protein EboE [Aquipuribacter sp. MA13-6]|uniref:metabolite traffic protein EboE n=1 Tax=unclassified Aquipuribacter TaxID=2635084 RepID=UPI003EEBD8AE